MTQEAPEKWSVSSIYGARTRKGLVQLRIGDRRPFVLEPAEARRVALLLLEGAQSAEGDEFLMAFLMDDVAMPIEKAAQVLDAFRTARQKAAVQDEAP